MRRILIVVITALLLALPAAAQAVPRFEKNACPFDDATEGESEGKTFYCGTLYVPESRTDSASPTIELAVLVIRSTAESPAPDPVIYLEGGPGGSALAAYDVWFASALRTERDIILIDQRGTGYSQPSLNCTEFDDDSSSGDPTGDCRARLTADGINIAAYTTAENAQDIGDLIEALKLKQANLFGVSYGTRLALAVLRDRPERIRSAIINSVYPPNAKGLDEQPKYTYQVFQVLFRGCAADAACNAAYPNLRQVFFQAIDDLNASPLTITDADGYETDLTGDGLIEDIFQNLYDTYQIPLLPGKIYAAAQRDAETYVHIGEDAITSADESSTTASDEAYFQAWADYLGYKTVDDLYAYLDTLSDDEYYAAEDEFLNATGGDSGGATTIDDDSEGMYNSVECTDDLPFNSMANTEKLSADIPAPLHDYLVDSVQSQFDDCQVWNVPPADASAHRPVTSDLPVLVASGEYDPITPPDWGKAAADALANSYFYVFPGMGHGVIDMGVDCPTLIALDFLDNPGIEPDAACIADMQPPEFYVAGS